MLHCDEVQIAEIQSIYTENHHFHRVFNLSDMSQNEACGILEQHGLKVDCLDDLGNGWSVRWSKKNNEGLGHINHSRRILLQW